MKETAPLDFTVSDKILNWVEEVRGYLVAMKDMNDDPEGPNRVEIELLAELKLIMSEWQDREEK